MAYWRNLRPASFISQGNLQCFAIEKAARNPPDIWRSLRCLACNGTRLPGKRRHLRIRQAGKRGHSSGKIKYWSLTTGETQASEVQRAAGVGLRLLGRQGNGLRMPNLACANRHWFARNRNGLRQPRMICADEQAPNSAQCKPNNQARPRKALK